MISAVCIMAAGAILGNIVLEQDNASSKTIIKGQISGLPPNGLLGFHVHKFGNLSGDCMGAGTHFNPDGHNHAGPEDPVRHVGDLGNIKVESNGIAALNIKDSQVQLYGARSVVGKSLVVHAKTDDLGQGGNEESLKTGNAGARLACCIIGITSETSPSSATSPTTFGSLVFFTTSFMVLARV